MKKKRFTVNDGSLLCTNEAWKIVATMTTFLVYIVTLKKGYSPQNIFSPVLLNLI